MAKILLYFVAPFAGVLPLDRLFGKKAAIVFSIIVVVLSAVLIYPVLFTKYHYADEAVDITVKAIALASVGLLFGQLTNLSDRKSFIALVGIIALVFSSTFITLRYFDSSLNHNLGTINQWKLGNYEISCHKELGIAGPAITKYTLFEFKLHRHLMRKISSTVENNDSLCVIVFRGTGEAKNYYFDKCNGTLTN